MAGVMNHFLMELPDPILTSDMYSLYIDSVSMRASSIPSTMSDPLTTSTESAPSAIVPRLKELISQLPPYNRYVLQHLMSFFQLVIAQESSMLSALSALSAVHSLTMHACR